MGRVAASVAAWYYGEARSTEETIIVIFVILFLVLVSPFRAIGG